MGGGRRLGKLESFIDLHIINLQMLALSYSIIASVYRPLSHEEQLKCKTITNVNIL